MAATGGWTAEAERELRAYVAACRARSVSQLPPDTKVCPHCAQPQPLAAFYPVSSRADGRSSYCRGCTGALRHARTLLPASAFEPVTEKPCTRCGQVRPARDFYRASQRADGLESTCIVCSDARRELRRRCHEQPPASIASLTRRWQRRQQQEQERGRAI